MKKSFFLALSLPVLTFGLEKDPWFTDFLEFQFRPSYEYNFFHKIDNSSRPLKKTIHTHVVGAGLEVTAPETWNWEMEIEFADTESASWGYRSFALQIRKLWLDDVCGDPVSLSSGIVYRDASSRFLKAFSTPYHARGNFELHTAMGKEWSQDCYWRFRIFALGAVGQGTHGAPWLRGDLTLWGNFQDRQQVSLYAKSYFGLGSKTTVPIDHFHGWANIGHHSVDLGGSYRVQFGIYGALRFDYLYRIYARSYPEGVNFFILSYQFPFSVL